MYDLVPCVWGAYHGNGDAGRMGEDEGALVKLATPTKVLRDRCPAIHCLLKFRPVRKGSYQPCPVSPKPCKKMRLQRPHVSPKPHPAAIRGINVEVCRLAAGTTTAAADVICESRICGGVVVVEVAVVMVVVVVEVAVVMVVVVVVVVVGRDWLVSRVRSVLLLLLPMMMTKP